MTEFFSKPNLDQHFSCNHHRCCSLLALQLWPTYTCQNRQAATTNTDGSLHPNTYTNSISSSVSKPSCPSSRSRRRKIAHSISRISQDIVRGCINLWEKADEPGSRPVEQHRIADGIITQERNITSFTHMCRACQLLKFVSTSALCVKQQPIFCFGYLRSCHYRCC